MKLSINCSIQFIHPAAKIPRHGNTFAAGYDIACVAGLDGVSLHDWDKETLDGWAKMDELGYVEMLPGSSFLFRTGLAQAIAPGYACFLWDRSGMGAKRMIHRLAGVIDQDYRGEWFVRLVNLSQKHQLIYAGDFIVQAIYQPCVSVAFSLSNDLNETERGRSGFGSTDNV